jgi:uncharacterized protein with ParB-like and HNH nuclease domain
VPNNPGIKDLNSILIGIKRLKVPDFQRNFAWEEKQIEDFHSGIMKAVQDKSTIFLGTTILMEDEDSRNREHFFIIDGQQRFTTIFMYLSIIRDLIYALPPNKRQFSHGSQIRNPLVITSQLMWADTDRNSSVLRYQANDIVKTIFDDHIQSEPPLNSDTIALERIPLPELDVFNSELINAYQQIKMRVSEELSKVEENNKIELLDNLANTIAYHIQILCIYTRTIPESFDIFLTLNSTGLPLGPSDLVKTIFMRHLSVSDSTGTNDLINDDVATKWRELIENVNDLEGPEQFLRHFLISKIKNESVTAKEIFRIIEEEIATFEDPISNLRVKKTVEESKNYARELLNELLRVSQIYGTLIKPVQIEPNNPNSVLRRYCYNLKALSDSYRIVLLHVLDSSNDLSESERIELARLCEVLTLRWSITNGGRQEIENIFREIAKGFRTNIGYAAIRQKLVDSLPLDEEVKSQFDVGIKKSNVVRVVLNRINSVLNMSYLISPDPSIMHVEHVAPQKPTNEWLEYLLSDLPENERKSDYAKYSEYWGNKTILEKPINTSIKQALFKVKCEGLPRKPGYVNSGIDITKNLTQFEFWTKELIKSRNDWIKDCFIKLWNTEDKSVELLSYNDWKSLQK